MSNQVNLFYRGVDSAYYYRNWDGTKWAPADSWEKIPVDVSLVTEPVATRWGQDLIYLFGIDIEGKLRVQTRDQKKGTWNTLAWRVLDGNGTAKKWVSKPAVAAVYADWMSVIVMAGDNTPYILMWQKSTSTWSNFESLGGSFRETPSFVSWGGGRSDIFALGLNGNVYHKWWVEGNGWLPNGKAGDWEELDGPFQTTPKAVTWGKDRLDLVGLARGGILRHNFWNGTAWSGWNAVGGVGVSIGRPEAIAWGVNRLHVFLIGDDRAIHHKWYDGSCDRWEPSAYEEHLGGKVIGEQVTASAPSTDRLDLFYVATDGVIYQKTCTKQTGWSDAYKSLGGTAISYVHGHS